MLAFLLYRVLCGLFRMLVRAGVDDRELEIAVLRHQLRILSRRGKGPRYSTADRAFLAAASRFLPRELWSAFPVAPDTLNRWRRLFLSRKGSNRRRPGRPPIDPAVRELILRMARENPRWGYLRIKGELLKLGTTVSATTIANMLRRGGLGPAPRRIGPTWAQFLRAQAFAVLATGGAPGSDHEDRGRQGEARTPPARDSGDRPSLQKECPRATLLPLLPQSVLPSEVWSTRDGIDRSGCWLRGRYPLAARALATDRPPLSFLLPIRVTEAIGMARGCASRLNPGRRPVRPPFEPRQPTLPGIGSMFGSALNSKPPRDRVLAPNSFRLSALSTPRARRALAPVGRSIRS